MSARIYKLPVLACEKTPTITGSGEIARIPQCGVLWKNTFRAQPGN
jgi:hypothetical protein